MNNKYPYTDVHELNLDWILAKMKELRIEFDEFKVINQISFSGAWDITKNYPAWTIVSDNNIGYVSIQPVPAGVLLTNGDYWREVIDYTAQIAGLQSRVVALEGDMLTVQGDITTINSNINTLNGKVSLLDNRRFILVSDSYGANADNWIDYFIEKVDNFYTDFYRVAAASHGFVGDPGVPGSTFLSLLQANEGSIPNHNTITDIIVVGGINDAYSGVNQVDIESNGYAFANYCKSEYPNAHVYIAMGGYSTSSAVLPRLYQVCHSYQAIATQVGPNASYMPNIENAIHFTGYLNGDGIHPNAAGMKLLGYSIADSILTGGCKGMISNGFYSASYVGSGIASTYTSFDAASFFKTFTCGNICGISGFLHIMFSTGISVTCSDDWQEIATITSNRYVNGNPNIPLECQGGLSIYDGTLNTYVSYPASYKYADGKVYVKVPHKQANGGANITYSDVRQLKTSNLYMIAPALTQ